ncbi:MAG: chemotaxis response regulator protein-glutamate methylesterase [Burkholderiales bacterium]|nr:chemotaxis response regulator protein-glutamate methylesterase [Burkholderiales bacterium]
MSSQPSARNPVRVLIVEDSPIMQQMLKALLETDADIEVVGTAPDPFEARERIKMLKPDVLTLDVEMPRMDGLTFLSNLMRLRPMPVVMVSSLTEANADTTLKALELGAVDFATKPSGTGNAALEEFGDDLRDKVRNAAKAELKPVSTLRRSVPPDIQFKPGSIIAIGASTGGTEAIKEVLTRLPANCPPIVMVQHMPEMFTRMFAKRLNDDCPMTVKEGEDGEYLQPGHAYLAPGDWHMRVTGPAGKPKLRIEQTDPVNRHRPSVDVLFQSVAELKAAAVAGVLLTGMGRDGADGMGLMKAAGAFTFAQSGESCVVYGMPRAAIEAGFVDCAAPVENLATNIMDALKAR